MSKKKSEVDVGKGLDRILKVLAGAWVLLITFLAFADFSFCVINADKISVTGSTNANSIECLGYDTKTLIVQWLFMSGLAVPIYYFFIWIGRGFKK